MGKLHELQPLIASTSLYMYVADMVHIVIALDLLSPSFLVSFAALA